MGDKTAYPLVEPLDLRVTDAAGNVRDYRTSGVDVYRVERFTGKAAGELTGQYSALAYMAYSAARRAGDAYRQRKDSTSEADLFEAWLVDHEVSVLKADDDDDEAEGADPKDRDGDEPESEPTPTSSLDVSR